MRKDKKNGESWQVCLRDIVNCKFRAILPLKSRRVFMGRFVNTCNSMGAMVVANSFGGDENST